MPLAAAFGMWQLCRALWHLWYYKFNEQQSLLHLNCHEIVSYGEVLPCQSAKIGPKIVLQLWYVQSISSADSLTLNYSVLFPLETFHSGSS